MDPNEGDELEPFRAQIREIEALLQQDISFNPEQIQAISEIIRYHQRRQMWIALRDAFLCVKLVLDRVGGSHNINLDDLFQTIYEYLGEAEE